MRKNVDIGIKVSQMINTTIPLDRRQCQEPW